MRMRIACATLLLMSACSERRLEVEFAETALTAEEMALWSRAGIRSAHDEISVRRTMRTPSWCRDLEAEAVRVGNEVTLRVMAIETDDDCPPGEGLWAYVAEIRGLRRGEYTLRVVHTYADPRRPSEVVLKHPVVVE